MSTEIMIELALLAVWIGVWTWIVFCGMPKVARWTYRGDMTRYQRTIARRNELLPRHRPMRQPEECGCGGMKDHRYECAYTSPALAPNPHRTR